jgi:hypothetical protein
MLKAKVGATVVVGSFDPTHAVRFDLSRGSVCAGGEGDRVVLVPTAAIEDIVLSAGPEVIETLGRAIGSAIGRRAASRMGDPQNASVEDFVTQLSGEAALSGIGTLSAERWGRALVILVEAPALPVPLLEPLIRFAIETACGRRVWCTLLSRDDRTIRVFVGGEAGTGRVRASIASGVAWDEALVKLHGGRS